MSRDIEFIAANRERLNPDGGTEKKNIKLIVGYSDGSFDLKVNVLKDLNIGGLIHSQIRIEDKDIAQVHFLWEEEVPGKNLLRYATAYGTPPQKFNFMVIKWDLVNASGILYERANVFIDLSNPVSDQSLTEKYT